MTDSYQAIYDAVRSRLSNGDIGVAVESALRQTCDASHVIHQAQAALWEVANSMQRPSVLYRPALSVDGNMWCALYGDDLQAGIAGFGPTPAEAMLDFDANWHKKLNDDRPRAETAP